MSGISSGWALEIRGASIDLNDIKQELGRPFDPWVEEYDDSGKIVLLLRTRQWIHCTNTNEMMAISNRLIEELNGALCLIASDAGKVTAGAAFKFDDDGNKLPVSIELEASFGFGRVRTRAVLSLEDGSAVPVASATQRRIEAARSQILVSGLLIFTARADNWFDIYKAMETLEDLVGGDKAARSKAPQWKNVKQTANHHRHASEFIHQKPRAVVTIDQAREVIIALAQLAV